VEFQIKVRELTELLKRTGNKNEKIREAIRYKNEDSRTTLATTVFAPGELKTLAAVIDARLAEAPTDRHNKWVKGRLRAYFELFEGKVSSATKVKNLQMLPIAIQRYLEESAPHRWIFRENSDHILLPYLVTDIKYFKRRRERGGYVYPAYVKIDFLGYKNGSRESESASIDEDAFTPTTVPKIFEQLGLSHETPAAVAEYTASLETYGVYQNACGVQALAIGVGFGIQLSRWQSRYSQVEMVRNGQATKVVLDPRTEELEDNKGDDEPRFYTVNFWEDVPDRNGLTARGIELDEDEDEDEDEDDPDEPEKPKLEVMLPLHPYLYCFDLDTHSWINLHAANLQPYDWDKTLLQKLILPQEQKDLLQILISSSGHSIEDIVRGKMSGVIVLATGAPGTGKTLTAEVFSEYIEKPLYNVQCSQLGLSVDTIESNLQEILQRASRWGAVLLIDESDVYIRNRGEDITQNAIVGVFLRLLEYYRGVLFMTSNRGNIVDDAILSRATAWIQYQLPSAELLATIWSVLCRQYRVELKTKEIAQLVKELPNISGRSVRNILKLATMLKKEKATVADIINVSKYQALEQK